MGAARPAPPSDPSTPKARAAPDGQPPRTAVLVIAPARERALVGAPGMSVGILSAIQGTYSSTQMLLDVGQGARVATSAYDSPTPPSIGDWSAVLARAKAAPQTLQPGLLASSVPGGAGYVGVDGLCGFGGPAAVDERGQIGALSFGRAATLLARIATMRARKRFVVVDLPGGAAGSSDLRTLAATRPSGELLIVLQLAVGKRGHELLWAGVAGLPGGEGRELTSRTTNQRGLLSTIDIAPTILDYLGVHVPADMRGQPIETDGALDASGLRSLMARLHVVGGRRLKALGFLLCAWALLLGLACAALHGAQGRRRRTAQALQARAMRVGALAVLWAPLAVLLTAAIEPSAAVEYATIVFTCFALGALSDALLPWPRAPLAPAVVCIVALVIDALAGTQLLMRSLLGPNPILGARFYGFGNELKPGLAVLALAGVAATLYPGARSRRAATAMACTGVVLAVIEGAARIGAGVGGVILVSAGFALATIALLPGGFSRKRLLVGVCAPLLALVLLAVIDLATAHGSGHFTGSILHARSAGDLRDVIVRRYTAAWNELKNHAMPAATAVALVYAAVGVRRRDRLLAPVGGDPVWLAALAGGLAAGVVGTLSEDSGPVLLVVAVFTLGCVCAYLWGRPVSATAAP